MKEINLRKAAEALKGMATQVSEVVIKLTAKDFENILVGERMAEYSAHEEGDCYHDLLRKVEKIFISQLRDKAIIGTIINEAYCQRIGMNMMVEADEEGWSEIEDYTDNDRYALDKGQPLHSGKRPNTLEVVEYVKSNLQDCVR